MASASKRDNRLDAAVAAQSGITRSQARSLIMEGRVRVGGSVAGKAGQSVPADAAIVIERPRRFVSRGGEKLERALDVFGVDVCGARALDVGASTGGFTDCLLQRGAAHVSAVDVGYGQLDWGLRNDPRVRVLERTNFRNLPEDAFGEPFDLIVADASFISLRPILTRAVAYLGSGTIVALVKPQYEAGRDLVGRGGVVRERSTHEAVLRGLREFVPGLDLVAAGVVASPLLGPAGNREFFLELRRSGSPFDDARLASVLDGEGEA